MTWRRVPARAISTNFWQRYSHPSVSPSFRTSNITMDTCSANSKLRVDRTLAMVCISKGHPSKFTLNIFPCPRFATTIVRPLNPYTDTPPIDQKISRRIGIFILRHSSMSNGPSLLVPRSFSKDSIRSVSNTKSSSQPALLDGEMNTLDTTIWDFIKHETYKETGLYLERAVGQFDCVRHVHMEDNKRVEQMTLNFVVAVRRGEMDGNLHAGAAVNWMWVTENQVGALEMKQGLKQVLRNAFACVEKTKDCLN